MRRARRARSSSPPFPPPAPPHHHAPPLREPAHGETRPALSSSCLGGRSRSREFPRPTWSRAITGPNLCAHAQSLSWAWEAADRRPGLAPALWMPLAEVGGGGVKSRFDSEPAEGGAGSAATVGGSAYAVRSTPKSREDRNTDTKYFPILKGFAKLPLST